MQVIIEEFRADHLPRIVDLFSTYFLRTDRLLSERYNRWLYDENPFGSARIVAAVADTKWIGFMALIPVRLIRGAAMVKAFYAVNVLVHPKFHGKNVFGKMISAAHELVRTESAVLMGHPNELALNQWRRRGMHFQKDLVPCLVRPGLLPRGVRASAYVENEAPHDLFAALKTQAIVRGQLLPDLTHEYIRWRFIRHPTNSYAVRILSRNERTVGLNVTRKVRPWVSLLIEHYLEGERDQRTLGCCPVFTIGFLSEEAILGARSRLWKLGWRKRLPFFVTCDNERASAIETQALGLALSDF